MHLCFVSGFHMIVSHQVKHAMDDQQGQFLFRGTVSFLSLTLGLREGDNHFAQGRWFAEREGERNRFGIFRF